MREWMPPRPIKRLEIRSPTGKRVHGVILLVYLLPEQFLDGDQRKSVQKVLAAAQMAQKMGAKIIGLGAFNAVIGRNGMLLADQIETGVTTGNCYTAGIAADTLLAKARSVGIPVESAHLAIIGATGSVGSTCARLLAPKVGQISMVARNLTSLRHLAAELSPRLLPVKIGTNIPEMIGNPDLILLATTALGPIINLEDVKPGAIVADVSKPDNVDTTQQERRPEVFFLDAGIVKSPPKRVVEVFDRHFPYVAGIDGDRIFSCFAETIILACEGHFKDHSLGRKLDLSAVRNLMEAGKRHGFSTVQ